MQLGWIILFPLFGFLINGLIYLSSLRSSKKISATLSGAIATMAMVLSFGVAALAAYRLYALPEAAGFFEETLFSWIKIAGLRLDFTLRLDSLSSVFVLVITGVGALIHLYSVGYMQHDETPARYFAYLNLFCFMMLNLVLGSNLPHVFLGWEGVGLASYLLIGYWHQDPAKVGAGMKAFVMNRVGDLGFLIAMFICFKFVGSLDFVDIAQATLAPEIATTLGLLIFFACTGKSAQIPLFTWLPDAMAGPTPVSALIHAATMVTSGIYLLARMDALILASPTTQAVIAATGAATAFVAALIACAQNDIKKILAYSTVSQLGFMFVACGVGFTSVGVFHVMTHAFFKALLFLGAGSVIHALHEEQDVFKMGGLSKKLPYTFWTFVVGWAAILGLPPMSGFFSKDEVLIQAFESPAGGTILFLVLIASALLTAFYMTRLLVLVFFGTSRTDPERAAGIHESPGVMTAPLVILGVLSVAGGWWGLPVASSLPISHGPAAIWIMVGSVLLSILAAYLAFRKYKDWKGVELSNPALKNGLGVDTFYQWFFGRGTQRLSQGVFRWVEEGAIQRVIRWGAAAADLSGNLIKVLQTGATQLYLAMMMIAVFVAIAWFLFGVGQYGKL